MNDSDPEGMNGIMYQTLSYLTTNLAEGSLDDFEDGDPDWESKGVFRPYW